jgi:hypothetical protein
MSDEEVTCDYSYRHLAEILDTARRQGYEVNTCREYVEGARSPLQLVLRHDIDLLPARALQIAQLQADLGVRGTYFVRLHANEYNALSHENLQALKTISAIGHEVGLHAEPVDLLYSTGVSEAVSVRSGLETLRKFVSPEVVGVASHNDTTPYNNLDYLGAIDIANLGGSYEAYDTTHLNLFANSWYVTDGHFWYWRLFLGGQLTDDRRCLCKHVAAKRPLVYALIHPHLWYHRHAHLTEFNR